MTRQLCLIHANCQGDDLKRLLEASPGFTERFEIRHLRNYKREALDQGVLDTTAIFLHQYLTGKWGEFSTDEVLARLPPNTCTLCIPNCFFKGYWPFWIDRPDLIQFTDSLIEDLLASGLSDTEILHLYFQAPPGLAGDIEAIAASSLAHEKEKERHTPIKYTHLIEESWRERQLFLTINHPAPALMLPIARDILKLLGLKPFSDQFASHFVSTYDDFWLPIHPVTGERLKLRFADHGRLYPCFGGRLNHRDYTLFYLACRRNGITDLPSALTAHFGSPSCSY